MGKYSLIILLVVVALAVLPQETSQSRSIRSDHHDDSGHGHHDGHGHVNHAVGARHYLSKRYADGDHGGHDGHSGHSGHSNHKSGDHGNGGGHGHDSGSHGHH